MTGDQVTTMRDLPVEAIIFFTGMQSLGRCGVGCEQHVSLVQGLSPEVSYQTVSQGHKLTMAEKFNTGLRRGLARQNL